MRHLVFGDQPPGYSFVLSPLGRADPYEAILRLFERQPAHKRSLVHCDYLVSLVHFRAFMASLGRLAFNARIAAHGPSNIVLRWNLFTELEPATLALPGLGSIRQVVPSSPRDLVIGDHLFFSITRLTLLSTVCLVMLGNWKTRSSSSEQAEPTSSSATVLVARQRSKCRPSSPRSITTSQ